MKFPIKPTLAQQMKQKLAASPLGRKIAGPAPIAGTPPAAPSQMAPSGNRPMGVAPQPLPNPMPMSPGEVQGRMRAARQRGVMPPQQAFLPGAEVQPGFNPNQPVAMAEGGRVRKKATKKSTKGGKRK